MAEDFRAQNEDALEERAERGMSGQGAVVKMMRRLRDAISQSSDATTRLNRRLLQLNSRLLWFTIAIFIVMVLQIGLSIWYLVLL